MPTYSGNAYEILSQVRYSLNEYSTAFVQATDTTGAFLNAFLMKHINDAQNFLFSAVSAQMPHLFLKSTTLTGTASVYALPADFWRMKRLENSDGVKIHPINVDQKHLDDGQGTPYGYYRYGSSLRIDQDSFTETLTIWYYARCRELDTGTTSAGGALSATLATTAKAIADYYNGMIIENVTDSTVDTITDYSAARVCTVSNTWASSKYYGIVSELPEVMQPLIAERAILTLKQTPKSPIKAKPEDFTIFRENLSEAMKLLGGTLNTDADIDSVINDFEPMF